MFRIKVFLIAFYLLLASVGHAQNTYKIDSLKAVIIAAGHDTTQVNALNALALKFIITRTDTANELAKRALELSETLEYVNGLIASYHNIGYVHYVQRDYEKAMPTGKRRLSCGSRWEID